MRYDEVMGQIDMYPTLLNLLQLDGYYWTGLGESILNPEKKGFAVGSQMNVEGEGYSPEDEDFAKEAYDISDEMIRFNYFGKSKIIKKAFHVFKNLCLEKQQKGRTFVCIQTKLLKRHQLWKNI